MGITYSYDGVARLMSRLVLVPDLTDVTLYDQRRQRRWSVQINSGIKGATGAGAPPVVQPPADTTTTGSES